MSVNAVSFTARTNRPYGYDPEKGEFTPEQAKKDFKPGLRPEKKESHAVRNTLFAIGAISAIAGGIYFFTKGKGIDKITKFYNEVKGVNFTETLKNAKDKGFEAVNEGWKAFKNAIKPKKNAPIRFDRKEILREYALASRDIKTVPLDGYKGVNVKKSDMNIGQRNKYVQDFEAAIREYEKNAAQV